MPDNHIPATKNEPSSEPGEFNFAKPVEENPRIRRRSLKTKPPGLIKPASGALPAARELEREAPPLSAEQAQTAKPRVQETAAQRAEPAVKVVSSALAPPRMTPGVTATPAASPAAPARTIPKTATTPDAAATTSSPASKAAPASTAAALPGIRSTATPTTSPHGTRPATLYYSSQTRKETEAPSSPMKSIPTVTSASSPSAAASPASSARPAASSRPAATVDYRANVERQSREQKSVGNILAYVVYALIAFFVISAGLAGYGAHVIFKQLGDQSVTVSDLDKKYADANQLLTAKLSATEDTLAAAQAQIARQQDLILRQQEDINKLIAASNDNAAAVKTERATRAQETASLRERVRELENRPTTQKY